ncbi:MAG: ligase-associated DNA damage response DEXH box helicase [Pseudomonadota bacterium]|nr:ligase-associated DNA damage response DEXH box helicase [Pseudomonadota bacterium]
MHTLPLPIKKWLRQKNWQLRPHQEAMIKHYEQRKSCLLIAPTGAGKTLAGLLPSLIDLINHPHYTGLHTLYISPLKALTYDIEKNLEQPIYEMQLPIEIGVRTGDTNSYQRSKQRTKPPQILLTTPESLMILLSYADAPNFFKKLRLVVIDECHSFAHSKRGDFTSLALSGLLRIAPEHIRFGLSATVADPKKLSCWLHSPKNPAEIYHLQDKTPPVITTLTTKKPIPYSGYSARYALDEIYQVLLKHQLVIAFVNTRGQAEQLFQSLWQINTQHIPIALYHGSLDAVTRRNTEKMMADGKIRAVVATSALELGIDWSNIDCVLQVGAPKGVCRLLQRIGRANHQYLIPSKAFLVPTNCFEALECQAAMDLIKRNQLDTDPNAEKKGALDVLAQYILNCCCQGPYTQNMILEDCLNTLAYHNIDSNIIEQLFNFHLHGGYALQAYPRLHKLQYDTEKNYRSKNMAVARKHRQNIGTIVEYAKLRVKKQIGKKRGKVSLGQIEERFIQQLSPGDTFAFAGEILLYEKIHDMEVIVRPHSKKQPKVPAYAGGQLPLSTHLEKEILALLQNPKRWQNLPNQIQDWLQLQQTYSTLPEPKKLIIEKFSYQGCYNTILYTFSGRAVNNSLGMLLSMQWEEDGYQPIAFHCNDYGLGIKTLVDVENIQSYLHVDGLSKKLDVWLKQSQLLKRSFREVATITGLIEQQLPGKRKTLKQVTFSTDLIFEVLEKYDPDHILLIATKEDACRELVSFTRLEDLLRSYEKDQVVFKLPSPSPLSIPILTAANPENIDGEAIEALLEQANKKRN